MGTRSAELPSVTKVRPWIVVVSHNVSLGKVSVSLKFQKVTSWANTVAGTVSIKANKNRNNSSFFVLFMMFMEFIG